MSDLKATAKKVAESPFFTFSRLPLEFFEKKKLFGLIFTCVCVMMAVGTLVFPFIILGRVISSGYFNFGVKYTVVFIFIWLGIVAACWLGFHLWWDKKKIVAELGTSEFIMLPFFSEILKTLGEWLGVLYGVIGAVGGLFALIFLGKYSGATLLAVLFRGGDGGPLAHLPIIGKLLSNNPIIYDGAVICGPIVGVLIIFISRFFAENLMVLAAIANNTKEKH